MNQRNLRNAGVLFFWIILFCAKVYAKENSLNSFPRTILEYYILESEHSEGKYLDGNINDYNFTKYDNCGGYFNNSNARNACPDTWQLPSDEDWMALELEYGPRLRGLARDCAWSPLSSPFPLL